MKKVNCVIDKVLNIFETYVCALFFFAMSAIIMIQVIFRAVGWDVAWTEESARYLFVWVIYLAAAKGVKNANHMSVDLLPLVLKGKARIVLYIFANLISTAFFVILAYFGVQVLIGMGVRPQFSAANNINMQIPYAAPYFGAAMMIIRSLQNLAVLVLQLIGRVPMEESESDKLLKKEEKAK